MQKNKSHTNNWTHANNEDREYLKERKNSDTGQVFTEFDDRMGIMNHEYNSYLEEKSFSDLNLVQTAMKASKNFGQDIYLCIYDNQTG